MPEQKHLQGVGPKERRQYEHLRGEAEPDGRNGERAEAVAARSELERHKQQRHQPGQ